MHDFLSGVSVRNTDTPSSFPVCSRISIDSSELSHKLSPRSEPRLKMRERIILSVF